MNHIFSGRFLVFLVASLTVSCTLKPPTVPVASTGVDISASDTTEVTAQMEQSPTTSRGPYQPSAERAMDLLHTTLHISFNWQKQHLLGQAFLRLKPYFYPQDSLVLDAKGFDIHEVTLKSGQKNQALLYKYDQRRLVIALGQTFTRQDTLELFIRYTAKPNDLKITGHNAIAADKGLYFINPLGDEKEVPRQIWTQGETESSSAWFPTIDRPNERMTQDFYITVEQNFKTLSNGLLVSSKNQKNGLKTDHWRLTQPHAPYLAMMAIGEYAVVKDKWRNLDVTYWVEPEYAATAKATFGRTPEMLEFFSKKLGVPYPWEKYAQVVVRDYVSGAMENTTASIFMEALQQDRRQLLDKNWDHIIAHELFHQWFGNLVTTESWANLPLNESFADYSEYLWAEHKYGLDEAALTHQEALRQYLGEAETKQEPLIRYRYQDKEDMFDSHSYAKGGRVLHMLRTFVGDEAFFLSLNRYLTQHKFTSVEIDNLRLAFEHVTGRDLKPFFDQWFLQPGHSVLGVTHQFEQNVLTIQIKQKQDTTMSPVYQFNLPVAVFHNGTWQRHDIQISTASQVFKLPLSSAPEAVVIDPEQTLLAQILHQKNPSELKTQFLQSTSYAAKSEALEKLMEQEGIELEVIGLKALDDSFWKIRVLGLELLSGSEAIESATVQKKIEALVEQDPNSTVRSTSMYVLSALKGLPTEIIEYGLKDSSYQVVAASIFAWVKTGNDVAALAPFLEYNNPEVVLALAASLTNAGENEIYDWYLTHARRLKGADQYYFVQSFGAFLLKKDIDGQERGWQQLMKVLERETMPQVKQAVFQVITFLAETEERQRTVQQLMEQYPDLHL